MANEKLIPQDLESLFGRDRPTLGALPQWYVLGGHCSNCERDGWVDRWDLERRFGRDSYIHQLRAKLRCMGCGNKGSNTWITAKAGRGA
jgi:hypothetical protein